MNKKKNQPGSHLQQITAKNITGFEKKLLLMFKC